MRTLKCVLSPGAVLGLLCSFTPCFGQGTIRFTFDGQPDGTGYFVERYYEAGMYFRPLGVVGPGNGFIRRGNPILADSGWPSNGTAYVQGSMGDSLRFSFIDGSLFGLRSVDVADYSDVLGAGTVYLAGYRHDGTVVTTDFNTGGLGFHTVYFDSRFTGLDRVEIPYPGWSLDNLVVSIPEPGTAALILTAVALARLRFRDQHSHRMPTDRNAGMLPA